MSLSDIFWLSYRDLAEKKVRTALTVVMVVIGVASIVALISLTQGIGATINNELASLGPTTILMISAGQSGFTATDTQTLLSLPNTNSVTPILTGSAYVLANNQNTSVTVLGVSPQGLQQLVGGNVNLYQGTMFTGTIAPSTLAGYSVAFPSTAGGAQSIFVGQPATLVLSGRNVQSVSVPIVGILQSYGSSIIPVDTSMILSLPAAETILHRSSFNDILVKAKNVSDVSALSTLITDIYGTKARIITTQQLAQTANSIVGGISTFLVLIAGISLVVAAIGIMNIMLIAVYERTHEIGILKSIGFKNVNILMVFLFQALIIGFLGGAVGIGVGTLGSYGLASLSNGAQSSSATTTTTTVAPAGRGGGNAQLNSGGGGGFGGGSSSSSSSFSFEPELTVSTILTALFVAILVSVVAGVYPAWRASKLEPIDALRQL